MGEKKHEQIMVSVICNAYNHEKYIEKTLQGFVNQETNFKFEVLIHDDASTDRTAEIIKQYEDKYPSLIKPIYQSENQWKINPLNVLDIQYSRVNGKYIALCEGDDYWIDNQKLQKQVDLLEERTEFMMCVHATYIYEKNKRTGKIQPLKNDGILKVEDTIRNGGGYIATNSIMFRVDEFKKIPEFMKFYDYTLQIYGALNGGIFYINEFMSVYNFMTEGSWSRYRKKDIDFSVKINSRFIDIYKKLDVYTDYRYSKLLTEMINKYEAEILWYKGDLNTLKNNFDFYNTLSRKFKIRLHFRMLFPHIYNKLWEMRYGLK